MCRAIVFIMLLSPLAASAYSSYNVLPIDTKLYLLTIRAPSPSDPTLVRPVLSIADIRNVSLASKSCNNICKKILVSHWKARAEQFFPFNLEFYCPYSPTMRRILAEQTLDEQQLELARNDRDWKLKRIRDRINCFKNNRLAYPEYPYPLHKTLIRYHETIRDDLVKAYMSYDMEFNIVALDTEVTPELDAFEHLAVALERLGVGNIMGQLIRIKEHIWQKKLDDPHSEKLRKTAHWHAKLFAWDVNTFYLSDYRARYDPECIFMSEKGYDLRAYILAQRQRAFQTFDRYIRLGSRDGIRLAEYCKYAYGKWFF